MNMRADFDCTTKRLLRDVLLHFRRRGVTIEECAKVLTSEDQAPLSDRALRTYYEKDKKTQISPDNLMRLSKFLAYEYGDTRIAESFLPEGYAVVKTDQEDGDVKAIICEIDETEGRILQDERIGDYADEEEEGRKLIEEGARIIHHAKEKRK